LFLIVPAAAACHVAPPPHYSPPTPAATPVAQETNETPTPAPLAIDETCPMAVPGTSVSVEDNVDGATLVFNTSGDITALRSRVISMANDHNTAQLKIGALPVGSQRTYAGGGATYPSDQNTTGSGVASGSGSSVGEGVGSGSGSASAYGAGSGSGSASDYGMGSGSGIAIPSDTGVGSGSAAGTKVIDHDDASNIGNESMILTHSRAQIEPFDGGVRLVYIADPPDVQALRDEVRLKAEHLKTGRCD